MLRLILVLCVLALPVRAETLRLATWNIAWLTQKPAGHRDLPSNVIARSPGDFALLAGYAARLAADVVALQEIDGEAAAARVFPPSAWVIHLTDERDVQRPGFAIRRGLRVTPNPDLAGLDLVPHARFSLRRGADITIEAGGTQLRLLSVHLKAGCRDGPLRPPRDPDCDGLSRQVPEIAGWIAARVREGVAFAVLGDFNRRMERAEDLTGALAEAAPMTRVTAGQSSPCWASGDGRGRPFIDHIFLGGPARDWLVPGSLRVLVYGERDPAFRDRLSDHCPVSVRLALP
ncbi:endonuclease/exonuclease/phosphatase family protein [Humitalea sp. 24SJ18S-53]|uniref:endonuclease/exonuclease/phosphatase family protein n=1 Tax=Humitalea sp. 24SJ18S-53 TaxID=3422307 RepID=UPI003D677DB6